MVGSGRTGAGPTTVPGPSATRGGSASADSVSASSAPTRRRWVWVWVGEVDVQMTFPFLVLLDESPFCLLSQLRGYDIQDRDGSGH